MINVQIRDKEELERVSTEIATLLVQVDTDFRGDVLLRVSELLANRHSQYFTSRAIKDAGMNYGYHDEHYLP